MTVRLSKKIFLRCAMRVYNLSSRRDNVEKSAMMVEGVRGLNSRGNIGSGSKTPHVYTICQTVKQSRLLIISKTNESQFGRMIWTFIVLVTTVVRVRLYITFSKDTRVYLWYYYNELGIILSCHVTQPIYILIYRVIF